MDLTDPNLVIDQRVRHNFMLLIDANLKKNEAIKIYDKKLQIVATFLLSLTNDKTAEPTVRKNAKTLMDYLGIRVKNPF